MLGGLDMPIYEYQCQKCGRTTEVMQKFSDDPLTNCPSCAGRLHRLISNCSFQLKGSGWYVTDYARKDSRKKEKDSESKKTDGKGEKTDSSTEKSPKP
jgi:putative FmdB family regulatory protein